MKKIFLLVLVFSSPINFVLSNKNKFTIKKIAKRSGMATYCLLALSSLAMTAKDFKDASKYSGDSNLKYFSKLVWPVTDLGATVAFLYCVKKLNDEEDDQEKEKAKDDNNYIYEYEDDSGVNLVKGLLTGWVGISSLIMAGSSIVKNYNYFSKRDENISISDAPQISLVGLVCATAGYVSTKLLPKSFKYLKKAYK